MKSLLEIHPVKLLEIFFLIAIFALPIALLGLGIKPDPVRFGLLIGFGLVILMLFFHFYFFPRFSKNREFLAQIEREKEASVQIRKLSKSPEYRRARIVGVVFLFLIFVVCLHFLRRGEAGYGTLIALILVFSFMTYYSRFLHRFEGTREYSQELEEIQLEGMKFAARWSFYRLLLRIVVFAIIVLMIVYSLVR